MLVRATDMSAKLKVRIKELHRIASEGEVFEVTPMRFDVLAGKNKYKAAFVKLESAKKVVDVEDLAEEPVIKEEVKEEVINEAPKPKKRGRKPKVKTDE